MNSYYMGFATELDVDDLDTRPVNALEKHFRLHLDRWRGIARLPFIASLERRGLLHTYTVAYTHSTLGFAEFVYGVDVLTPADASPETVAFLIRMDTGQFPMPEDWATLLAQGGALKLRNVMNNVLA